MRSVVFASHVAYLDDRTGCGVMVRPRPSDDVSWPGSGPSLHEADWAAIVRLLDDEGWEPLGDGSGDSRPCVEGYTGDGKQVIVLSGRYPVADDPELDEVARTLDELHHLAGLGAEV